jgi:hypothetical protein
MTLANDKMATEKSKDKQKVIGESFNDERIKSFLSLVPPVGVNADYHVLERAYRGMIAENFATLVRYFVAAGRDINAPGPEGKPLHDIIAQHGAASDYIAALKNT